MKIAKDKAVTVEYTLFNEKGEMLETSKGRHPLKYVHGAGLIKGFEQALEGRTENEAFTFTVKPEDAYGVRRDELLFEVNKEQLKDVPDLSEGTPLRVQTAGGAAMVVFVAGMREDKVLLDGNHPLAGMPLTFEVEVKEVRDATQEELVEARNISSEGCGSSCGGDTCGGGGCGDPCCS
jgi:FKBP-type peptidyl-prolyl cis-trans isomerase SlyD